MFIRNKAIFSGTIAVLLVGALLLISANNRDEQVLKTSQPQSKATAKSVTATWAPPLARSTAPSPTATRRPTATPTPEFPQGQAVVIGESAGGRPLEVHRFGQGETRQMIIAGIHGGYESNTVELADAFIDYLRENPDAIPAGRMLFILRLMNPDGYAREFGLHGRANANGVDLNRNWNANWQADWPRAYCWNALPISAGPAPMSEPETQAVAAFLQEQSIHSLISIHSAGAVIFAGGEPDSPRSTSLAQALAKANGYAYPGTPSLCAFTGMLADWADAQGIPAVDMELPDHAHADFEKNLKALKAFLEWE